MNDILIRLFGFYGTLIHGDTLVLDRWKWLAKRLAVSRNEESVLDVGCGSGAFTIGLAKRGYVVDGVSFDEKNTGKAQRRGKILNADVNFFTGDVRNLDELDFLRPSYDIIVCTECIEHIMDDKKLLIAMANRLKPGGRLFLTTPNFHYKPITPSDRGPFHKTETGWHVRKGYSKNMLRELCRVADLEVEKIDFCSGAFSQFSTWVWRVSGGASRKAVTAFLAVAPFRIAQLVFPDNLLTKLLGKEFYSICLTAYKPRFTSSGLS